MRRGPSFLWLRARQRLAPDPDDGPSDHEHEPGRCNQRVLERRARLSLWRRESGDSGSDEPLKLSVEKVDESNGPGDSAEHLETRAVMGEFRADVRFVKLPR